MTQKINRFPRTLFSLALFCLLLLGISGSASAAPIRVNSGREFLEAIQPNARIVLNGDSYRLSFSLDAIWEKEKNSWNKRYPNTAIEEVYDGLEFQISGIDNLTIDGAGALLTVKPRYATVLTFKNCRNITLKNLTLGHEVGGSCSGNVVNLSGCENVTIENCDLYGCGEIGIDVQSCRGKITVKDSIIRDCSSGPLSISDCSANFVFRNCKLTGSKGSGWLNLTGSKALFSHCVFGDRESELKFHLADAAVWDNCAFSQNVREPESGL